MARFYQIQIASVYLTSDGTAAGDPCKLNVPGVEDLLTTITGAAIPAIGGGSVLQLVPWTAGKQLQIEVETVMEDVWNDLVDLILDALTNDTSFTIIGTGDIGDFSVSVKPFPIKPFSAPGFRNGRIKNAVFKFITV